MVYLSYPRLSPDMPTTIDYQNDLNAQQLEAVISSSGPVLVIAGAGSGKTRTIVYRVARLVALGVDPSSILLLTFTRKASQEMLWRAAELLDDRVARVSGGTFHSTAYLVLRQYASKLGFDSSFSIMDQADSTDAFEQVKRSLQPVLKDVKGFPRARTIADVVSRSVGSGRGIQEVLESRYSHFVEFSPEIERAQKLYQDYKKANNLMDYDDLLVNLVSLLEDYTDVREEVSERWMNILVDEYQDTNPLQARIVRLMACTHDNVMVVGDDSQSIYSFRGADFKNIMDFPDLFPGTRVIRLEENYRSTRPILDLTNDIISRATCGYPKRLFTKKEGGSPPLAARPWSEREQSSLVVKWVRELHGAAIPLREIAVLFRAGFHSFDLEGELTRNGIPFVKYGGFKFLESLHIKDVLAHLRVVDNPKDRISWIRILRLLPGIGVKTAAKLAKTITENGLPLDVACLALTSRSYRTHLESLSTLICGLMNARGTITEKLEEIKRYYFPFLKENYDNYPKRMRDLDYLADLSSNYRSLNRFLTEMALEPPDEDGSAARSREDSLVLSTIHSSKGLEWHTVILIWAAEGRIPSPMALNSEMDIEEERRLLYVAMTRARHNLAVVAPQVFHDRRCGQVDVELSRFLSEMPSQRFHWIQPS